MEVFTLQKRQPRVQVSPMSMMVAVAADLEEPPQQSEMFGQRASSQTVCNIFSDYPTIGMPRETWLTSMQIQPPQIIPNLLEILRHRYRRLQPLRQPRNLLLPARWPHHGRLQLERLRPAERWFLRIAAGELGKGRAGVEFVGETCGGSA